MKSAETVSRKFLGTSIMVSGFLYLFFILYLAFKICLDLKPNTSKGFSSDEIFATGANFAHICGTLLPLSLIAICLGAIFYPKGITPLLRVFLYSLGGIIIVLNLYYLLTTDSFVCSTGSFSTCFDYLWPPITLLVLLIGLAVADRRSCTS